MAARIMAATVAAAVALAPGGLPEPASGLSRILAGGAAAQTPPPPAAGEPSEGAERQPPPPYETQLLRLAEIMGALAYLHGLCDLPEENVWRESMEALLDAEARTPDRKALLAGAYNSGFRGFQISHRTCTQNTRAVIARYLKEGAKIAQDIASRYGGG